MSRTPGSMEYTPLIETTLLYGKKILEYTKEELAALIIHLFKQREGDLEEKNRQIRFIMSLKKPRR